jgi:uncharacterized Ntn-hydrolase superfamily protein
VPAADGDLRTARAAALQPHGRCLTASASAYDLPITYSIVARDPNTGELGVAVQSHWFSVGPLVPWCRPGVGAVATQANLEVSYGPRALDLLAGGADPATALGELIAADPLRATRQVAIVDAAGDTAAHTGDQCMPFAGHVTGEGVCCQANIMASAEVWPAMLSAFEEAQGSPLARRLMAALHAAEATGGDLRGRQSAAIIVVPGSGGPWETLVSLRVEDHPEPLAELDRLLVLDAAYTLAGEGDERVAAGDIDQAARLYQQAHELVPDSHELRFWAGLGAAQRAEVDDGLALVASAIAQQPGWRELLGRLPADMWPVAPEVLSRLDDATRAG